jgi:hypothetical protein
MPLIAITRLRIRSFRFVPPFAWLSWRALVQARRSAGNLQATVRKAEGLAFWTITAWQDEAAMNAYRIASPHREAMPKLLDWCDEASVVHWTQESAELPDWATAEMRMAQSGRLSKVRHPSADQRAGRLDYRQNRA